MRHHRTELMVILGALTAFAPLAIDMYPARDADDGPEPGGGCAAGAVHVGELLPRLRARQAGYGPVADRFGRKPPLYAG
ncbi:MAG: hypothetical protein WDO24_20090 [Pseudomonadota bacterium]